MRASSIIALVAMVFALADVGTAQTSEQQQFFDIIRASADSNEPFGQRMLGVMYQEGFVVPQSATEAVAWYRKAADQGDSDSQLAMALMYDKGIGVSQDEAEATRWYYRTARVGEITRPPDNWQSDFAGSDEDQIEAAQSGNVFAQMELAFRHEHGLGGFPKNDEEAIKWYRKAAEQSSVGAMLALGRQFAEGRIVPPNTVEAMQWFRKAGEIADVSRREGLRTMYLMYQASPKQGP